ncbi:MAG: SDR family oxidoreductase [Gemmatimonadota bacterium]|nr:SDR family oxidoreductase [Gemmatimonadota bacterium]
MRPDRTVALVTGASSGIGREIARIAAERGHDLVLVARGEDALAALAGELSHEHGAESTVLPFDLSLREGPSMLVETVDDRDLAVDVLVNAAGFGLYGEFLETDLDVERGMIDLNVGAVTELAKAYARRMAERGSGRILNVASTAAFQPGPRMAVYYATKAYVLSFSVALAVELEQTGVTVTCLAPGPTETGFQHTAGAEGSRVFADATTMDAVTVARKGWEAMAAGRTVYVPGAWNRIGAGAAGWVPRRIAAKIVARLQPET